MPESSELLTFAAGLPPRTEFRVRIARRWFDAAYVEDLETGQSFLGVKLNGCDWARIAEGVVEEWREKKAAGNRQQAAVKQEPSHTCELPAARCQLPAASVSEFISHADVETRITAMIKLLKYMSDSEARFLTAGDRVTWPPYIYDAGDIRAQAENQENKDSALRKPRHKASPRDHTQLDETYAWFQKLDPLDAKERRYLIRGKRLPLSSTQMLVWRVALGASFYSLAKYHEDYRGTSDETLSRRHDRALERLHAIANASFAKRGGRFDARRVASLT